MSFPEVGGNEMSFPEEGGNEMSFPVEEMQPLEQVYAPAGSPEYLVRHAHARNPWREEIFCGEVH